MRANVLASHSTRGRAVGEVENFRSVDVLQSQATAAATVCGVAHDHIRVDEQTGADAIAWQNCSRSYDAIYRVRARASSILIGRPHDEQSAAVGCDRRIRALVELDRVVFDVAVVAEPDVRNASAVTGAHVAADPVEVELVVIAAAAKGNATCSRGGRRE